MQNKFGLKDFVLMVLVVIVGIISLMNIYSGDRQWKKTEEVLTKINSVEQQVAKQDRNLNNTEATTSEILEQLESVEQRFSDLDSRLSSGAFNISAGDGSTSGSTGGSSSSNTGSSSKDGWARPDGTPIDWQPEYNFVSDPTNEADYRFGGEFTEIFPAQLKKITPVLAEDTYARRVAELVCDSLAAYNPATLALEGVLAEAWQYDANGYWLRVKLRDNISFSDGVEITAEDVRWTFHDYINNPEYETEALRSILTSIEKVEVISEKVVEFTFNQPDAYNLQSALANYVLPKHFYTSFTPNQINQSTGLLMGSGPYKLDLLDIDNQWKPGQDIVLVRNEQYWAQRSAVDSMRFKVITEDIARLTEFRNGDASMIPPSSPQFVSVSRERGWADFAYSLDWVNMRSGYAFIAWQCGPRNGRLTPFHDKRVRQAMTMIIDRQLIIDDIYSGIGEVAVGPNNPPSPAANPEIEPWPYDLDRAKELLTEAGWVDTDDDGILENERGDEFSFEFTRVVGSETSRRLEKYVVDQCAAVGIICNPRRVDWSLYDQILKNRDFDSLVMGWAASAPESDPKQIWHTDSIQNQGHNFIQWDAGQDQYIDKIKLTLDTDERMKVFHQFHELVHEEQPYTFVRVGPWLRFINKDFKNVHPYPSGLDQREYYFAD